eukprot:15365271-Ditylum_brightwellii.AAC.2
MQYYITTAFGTATQSNFFERLAALYSIGQGSTDRPSGWMMLSDMLLKCYHTLCKGFAMANPANGIKLKCNADMFVIDNTLMHNDPQKDATPNTLMTNIQHGTETWSRLLWASGGLLEFLKSTYFLLIWAFTASGQPMITPEEDLPINIVQLTDANGNTTVLRRVSASKGIKMLVCACPLQAHESWLGYTTVYKLCISYPLSTTSFDAAEVKKLHKSAILHILPKLGYQRNFLRAVAFGTKFSGGIGMTHITAAQLSSKISGAVKHVRTQTKTGQKFLTMTWWAQLSAGTGVPILEEICPLPYLEGKWLC